MNIKNKSDIINNERNNNEIFSIKDIIFILFFTFIGLILLNIFKIFISFFNISLYGTWPVYMVRYCLTGSSITELVSTIIYTECIIGLAISILIFIAFLFFIKIIYRNYDDNFALFILIGIVLIICTNLIQGFLYGFIHPICGDKGYLGADTNKSTNLFIFISNYENLQADLGMHSQTHPPGAALLYYFLESIFYFPALQSIVICIISTISSAYFLYGILIRKFKKDIALYMTFLYLLLPAVQIFYLAHLYSIVTSLILGVLYYYMHPKPEISKVGAIICLFLVSFLTFMFIFIIGVLFGFEILNSRSIKKLKNLFIISLSIFLIYSSIFFFFGFNYVNSFLIASRIENPDGFRLIANPSDYLITRIEDILEIMIFFGPFLLVLFIRGIRNMKRENPEYFWISISALITLLMFFIAGAYRTGETARGCLFIFPFLLFPIASYLNSINITEFEKKKILILIFTQTLFMQFTGRYFF